MSPTRLRHCKIIRKWKKGCVKKSKNTSHISIRAFNKKDNKIYYQNYDDDAKNTTINNFHYDWLAEIFTYLPLCKRPKIASVCKKWRKTCVKKSKVASHISTRAFNKKDNKIYYQRYYGDAKNTIEFVNDDCLAEIFMYLPACERPKIAAVCKKWKQALDYSWQNVKKLELTHWEYNECPSYLKKYPEIYGQVRFLRSLLDKCGRYLTELDLSAHGYDDIVPVINESCPNLVKLRLRFKNGEPPLNAFSRLSKLKVLKIIFQHVDNKNYIPDTLIDSLRNVAGTLTELTLSNWNKEQLYKSLRIPESFIHVIPQLKALKLIETAGILIDTNLSMHLKKFGILVSSHDKWWLLKNIHNTLRYNSVTMLDLKEHQTTDDGLYTIANCLKHLSMFRTLCERITDAGMVVISRMSNLTYLHLRGPSHVTDSSIKLLKNLEILHLPYSNKITDVSIMKIFENSPKMKTLYFLESALSSEFFKRAAEIATNRKIFVTMGLVYTPGITQYESKYLRLVLVNSLKKRVYWSINFKDI